MLASCARVGAGEVLVSVLRRVGCVLAQHFSLEADFKKLLAGSFSTATNTSSVEKGRGNFKHRFLRQPVQVHLLLGFHNRIF